MLNSPLLSDSVPQQSGPVQRENNVHKTTSPYLHAKLHWSVLSDIHLKLFLLFLFLKISTKEGFTNLNDHLGHICISFCEDKVLQKKFTTTIF